MESTPQSVWTRRHDLRFPGWAQKLLTSLFRTLFSRRALRRYLFGLASLVTLIALFYAEEDWRGHFAWNSYARKMEAKGVNLNWQAFVPPPVPDDQNAAMTPLFAGLFDYVWSSNNTVFRDTNIWQRMSHVSLNGQPANPAPKLDGWVQGRAVNLKEWQTYFRRTKFAQTNGSWAFLPMRETPGQPGADVLMALGEISTELTELRQASTRPFSRFPIHYAELPMALLPHMGFLKRLSQSCQLRAIAELETGAIPEAAADIKLSLFCAQAAQSEVFFGVLPAIRALILNDDMQAVWEGLAAHRWSDAQLQEFQRALAAIDLLSDYQTAVRADAAFRCGWIDKIPNNPGLFVVYENNSENQYRFAAALPRGWYFQNELTAARFFNEQWLQDASPEAQRVYPGASRTNYLRFCQIPKTPYSFVFKQLAIAISPQDLAHSQTDINLARVACALERYRMAHGQFPEKLEMLTPDCIEKLPHDLINGEPLKYRVLRNGKFVLYSVGWNEHDDGGSFPGTDDKRNPNYQNTFGYHEETGDWVWRYPDGQ